MRDVDLSRANISNAAFLRAELSNVRFRDVMGQSARFSDAKLQDCVFDGAALPNAALDGVGRSQMLVSPSPIVRGHFGEKRFQRRLSRSVASSVESTRSGFTCTEAR